jgi:porin
VIRGTDRQTGPLPEAAITLAGAILLGLAMSVPCSGENADLSVLDQSSLTDTPGGLKDELRSVGMAPDFWVTQFYQGQTAGNADKTWRYGGIIDAFLELDAEKLVSWPGFRVNLQYEHYLGQNINRRDAALRARGRAARHIFLLCR